MSTNKSKLMGAAIITSCAFGAFACGGASEQGGESNAPIASASSSAPKVTTHAVAAKPAATVTAATPAPPDSTLPAPFDAANEARKAADAQLATLIATKETSCDVIAAALTKFTADNTAAYSVWNAEYAKLSTDQMKIARSRAMGGAELSLSPGGFKACLDKKDPKLGIAMRTFLGVATSNR